MRSDIPGLSKMLQKNEQELADTNLQLEYP